jgi:hypothetical protein
MTLPDPTHELSVPGGRPLCGADADAAPPPDPVHRVTCPACARLVEDGERRVAHANQVRSDESED